MSIYTTDIGLEVHVQLKTESKAFSGEKNQFGDIANSNLSYTSLALPGTLPMLNKKTLEYAVTLGLALECEIAEYSYFDRKNYSYPDLPKSYQITQDAMPICKGGHFMFRTSNGIKKINIHHIHIEEDAGKSIHDLDENVSCIDLNRAGTPLLEVVTEPEFKSGQEVYDFIAAFQTLLRFLDVSDANMEEGSLRVDCNISVREANDARLGTRTEIKNVNSKKFARDAINYEADRQVKIIQQGRQVIQESRQHIPEQGITQSMRRKEDALDYRYFPEPDLGGFQVNNEWLDHIKATMGRKPQEVFEDLIHKHALDEDSASILSSNKTMANAYYILIERIDEAKVVSDFIIQQSAHIPQFNTIGTTDNFLIDQIVELLEMVRDNKVSVSSAYKTIVPALSAHIKQSIEAFAKSKNIIQEEVNSRHVELCQKIITDHPKEAKSYINGKKALIGFFMGQFMRESQTSTDPKEIQRIFVNLLSKKDD